MSVAGGEDPKYKDEIIGIMNCTLSVINPAVKNENDLDLTNAWVPRRRIIKIIRRIIRNSDSDEE